MSLGSEVSSRLHLIHYVLDGLSLSDSSHMKNISYYRSDNIDYGFFCDTSSTGIMRVLPRAHKKTSKNHSTLVC